MTRIEKLHNISYIHRDLKPENFIIGKGNEAGLVYLIDFGLCKPFRDLQSYLHNAYRENKSLTGTARYASINAHLGIGRLQSYLFC